MNDKLTCLSLTCTFNCESQEELEEHEKEHKAELEKSKICEDCECNPCECDDEIVDCG